MSILMPALTGCYFDNKEDLYQFLDVTCDTSAVSYGAFILPVLENECLVCHGQSSQQGGVNLEGYNQVRLYATNGRLFGAVNHGSGFVAMPPTGQRLAQCTIDKIQAWIDKGAPDT